MPAKEMWIICDRLWFSSRAVDKKQILKGKSSLKALVIVIKCPTVARWRWRHAHHHVHGQRWQPHHVGGQRPRRRDTQPVRGDGGALGRARATLSQPRHSGRGQSEARTRRTGRTTRQPHRFDRRRPGHCQSAATAGKKNIFVVI